MIAVITGKRIITIDGGKNYGDYNVNARSDVLKRVIGVPGWLSH